MKRYLLIALCIPSFLYPVVIGSDSTVSRQNKSFFKKIDNLDNLMKGFSVFEKGIVLEDSDTEVSFDAFFPVSGEIVLNGGTLKLSSDMEFRNPFRIGVGRINGNGLAMELPRNISYLDFPSIYYVKLIVKLLDSVHVGSQIYSLDWNYDETLLAVALKGSSNEHELRIYSFNGQALSQVASEDFGTATIYSARWHPAANYLATGASSGTELKIWSFNTQTNSLSETDSANIGTTYGLSWSNQGDFLAVGQRRSSSFSVYPVSNGVMGAEISGGLGSRTDVMSNAIAWHSSDNYLAIGTDDKDLFLYSFDGSSLTLEDTVDTNAQVNALSWLPGSYYLTAGLQTNNESLRMFLLDSSQGLLSEVQSARVGLTDNIFGLRWAPDGRYLAVSKDYSYQNFELEIYYYDTDDQTLHLVSGYSCDGQARDVGWTQGSKFVATGDDNGDVYLFTFEGAPFVFNDLKLFLRSELRTHASIMIEGDCVINGDGNILDLSRTSSLLIKPDSHLTLEDITIKGINNNILCMADSSQLTLRDTKLYLDGGLTFSIGSFNIINEVEIAGSGAFVYESALSSTIDQKSEFIIDSNITFSYDPTVSHSSLFHLFEKSSVINLNGGTIRAGKDGFNLLDGTLRVSRDSVIASDDSITMNIGNEEANHDCYVDIFSGATLRVSQGSFHYKNALQSSWNTNSFSILYIGSNAQLILHTMLNIGNGMFYFDQNAYIYRLLGGNMQGNINAVGTFNFEYQV